MKDLTKEQCSELLKTNYIGRIAFMVGEVPYILPITYHYDPETNSLITYSGEGAKIEAMRKNGQVSFQVDEIKALNKWKSVLVHGKYEELNGIDARHLLHKFAEGVKKTILKKDAITTQFISEFSSKEDTDAIPIVYRINIIDMKGKERE